MTAAAEETRPRMGETTPVAGAPAAFRVAAEFAIGGDLRFLSHHDELRLLARALIRARWPVAYSHGFNPLPRLVVPLPRSLGITADSHWALADLREPRPAVELFDSLAAVLPESYRLLRVVAPLSRVMPHALGVTYEIELEQHAAEQIAPSLERLTDGSPLVVQRDGGPHKPTRMIDIQPYIEEVELNGCVLRLRLRIENQRTARPSEILEEIGLAAQAYNHRLRRADVQWDIEFAGPTLGPVTHERKRIGKEDDNEGQDQDRS